MTTYSFKKIRVDTVEIIADSASIGTLRLSVYRPGNGALYQQPAFCQIRSIEKSLSDYVISFHDPAENVSARIVLKKTSSGLVGIFSTQGEGWVIVKLLWELPEQKETFNFVPAFMYGNNAGGKCPQSTYPQLTDQSEFASTPWRTNQWQVRTDRSSHGFTAILGDKQAFALGGNDVCRYTNNHSVAEKTGISTSSKTPGQLSFSLGFANQPYTYSALSGRNFITRPEGYIHLDKGEVSCDIFILAPSCTCRQDATDQLLRRSYEILHTPVSDDTSLPPAIESIANALIDYGYHEEVKNFYTTFTEENAIDDYSDKNFCVAWTSGAQVAYPLLMAGYMLNKPSWVTIASDVLENLVQHGLSEKSNLFFENYNHEVKQWSVNGWWWAGVDGIGHSAYVNGQMCYYLLEGYLLERSHQKEHKAWLSSSRKVLDHVLRVRDDKGRFGYTYNEDDGTVLDAVGFCGVWFIPALVNLFIITDNKQYLLAADEAMDAYRPDIKAFEVFGSPHDAFKSPDQEGVLGWIQAAKILHQLTGKQKYLDDLLDGLNYEFSWKFAYNVVNEIEPLKTLNWASTGGSVTSVNNSHIHPMGSSILPAIGYAAEITGDAYLRSRFDDTLSWTLNAYLQYDGHYGWGKRGMVNERFCYTDSLLLERFADGSPASTWFCGQSWASGSILEGLAGILAYQESSQTKQAAYVAKTDPKNRNKIVMQPSTLSRE